MVSNTQSVERKIDTINYLCDQGQVPQVTTQTLYNQKRIIKDDFSYIQGAESHKRRRKMILKKHPQIAQLLQVDKPYSIIITLILVPIALAITYYVKDASWPVYLSVLYFVGGTYGHTLHCLIHDFTHYGGHKQPWVNKLFAMICNIPQGVPSALSFGKHHANHHNYLGQQNKDPDLPTVAQCKASAYLVFKWFFFGFMTFFYALRPVFFYKTNLNKDQVINFIFIMITDFLIYKYWGLSALVFCLCICLISIGGHPGAIHVLAQHFQFVKGLQTYDYLGIWNIPNLDLGYHIQHHDFPTAPWWNLRKIRRIAPQFYQNLPSHTSYTKVILTFLFDKNFSLFNRTIRINKQQ